jgi:hypothetical protein
MARIAEQNRRYRSKDQICEDVAFILNAPLCWGTKFAVLAEAVWVWSEFDGKYKGCRYWSRCALREEDTKRLIHEHAVPKSVIIEKLEKRRNSTPASVRGILSTYCIGVVITKKEDQKLTDQGFRKIMPEAWDRKDIWARYRRAGIKWVDCAMEIKPAMISQFR